MGKEGMGEEENVGEREEDRRGKRRYGRRRTIGQMEGDKR